MTSAKQQAQMCGRPTEIHAVDGGSMDGTATSVHRFTLHDVRLVGAQTTD
ncbi:hypothetical protein [Actinocrinis sp.]|nr:hypothetical protein [Actinocrinis sp.]HXR71338.1 hypothetical protein [Actinocrinis sp.]